MNQQMLYGPSSIMNPLYGSGLAYDYPQETLLSIILGIIFSTTTIIISFIIGSILFLVTKKKIFIIIPLILSILYFIFNFIVKIFGIYIP